MEEYYYASRRTGVQKTDQEYVAELERMAAGRNSGSRRPRGVGSVDVYAATDNDIPDHELLNAINDYLQQRREISVDLKVLIPTTSTVDISVAIQPSPYTTFEEAQTQVETTLRSAFTGALLGKGVTLAYLSNLLYHLDSVSNYHIFSPAEDVAASPTILPALGSLTITELEA